MSPEKPLDMYECAHPSCKVMTSYYSQSLESYLCEEHRIAYEVDGVMPKKEVVKTPAIVKNPLRLGRIRNKICICQSGKKVKHCCGQAMYVGYKTGQLFTAAINGDKNTFDLIRMEILKELEESENAKKVSDTQQ